MALPGLHIVNVGRGVIPMADVICTCTSSSVALFDGSLVPDGAHLNLVGVYRPDRTEVDSALMNRATIVVDDYADAWHRVVGDLHDVVDGRVTRSSVREITVFKSVGLAVEDLAVARLAAIRAGLLVR